MPLVETVILPDEEPAGIFSGLSETEYSLASAVPERVNGISISLPLTVETVAVIINSVSEFSSIESELCENDIVGGSSLSVIVKLTAWAELVAFSISAGVITTVSSFSSDPSEIPSISKVPLNSPALIVIAG